MYMCDHQSAWSDYKTVRWTVKIAAQNVTKIAILKLKMGNFSDPSPVGRGHQLTISHPLGALGASILAPPTSPLSAPRLAPAALDHLVPPRFWKSGNGPASESTSLLLVRWLTVWVGWLNMCIMRGKRSTDSLIVPKSSINSSVRRFMIWMIECAY